MSFTKSLVVGGALAALALGGVAQAETVIKVCVLTGSQAVPPNPSSGTGCGRFEINTETNVVRYHIVYEGMMAAETVSHIHGAAAPGVNAGVKHGLPLGSPKTGAWTYPEADEADILAGNMYVNVHSGAFPGGELRGQISDMVALLDGTQSGTGSSGSGVGLFEMDRCTNTLRYYILSGGLGGVETAAHIHGFSLHGTGSGVVHPLPAGSPKVGAWTFTDAEEDRIADGMTYVNIHSTIFGGGEIRGQITSYVNPIDGGQVNPPVATPGAGCALIAVDRGSNTLSYEVQHGSLLGAVTNAHIHGFAAPGVNAGVLSPIGVANPAIGSWAFGAANLANVIGGLTYVNVHTAAFGGGEIRGQLLFNPPPCRGDLDCSGDIGFADLLAILSAWGPCAGCPQDLDMNGVVGFSDLLIILSSWGPCP